MHHHLAQAVGAGGVGPFALASADGRGSDWRPAPGDDPFGMLLDELLPLLSGLGLRTGPGQVAVLGWSMGAADALRLAQAAGARGCHDGRFWQHLAPAQLRFVASVLGASSWPGDRRHRLPVTDVTGRGWLGGPE